VFGETSTLLLTPIWFGSSVSERASNCSKVTLGWFKSMCDPYRTLGRSVSARVRMPPLSLLLEPIPDVGGDEPSAPGRRRGNFYILRLVVQTSAAVRRDLERTRTGGSPERALAWHCMAFMAVAGRTSTVAISKRHERACHPALSYTRSFEGTQIVESK
jgi:hypothetical protein